MTPSGPLILRIAMLNADSPVPNVAARVGTYGKVFHNLLQSAAKRISPNVIIDSEDFDVVRGEYPPSASDFEALIITGSAASSYYDRQWIHELDEYLLGIYENYPRVKIFGSCFGHQIVCQSILRKYGVVVEKNPQGWELGVHEIQLNEGFVKLLLDDVPRGRRLPTPDSIDDSTEVSLDTLRLQFIHADHVRIPEGSSIPSSWITIGKTDKCTVQGVYQRGRVLTYQGHFEFDRFINSETLKVFGASWDGKVLQSGLASIDHDDDAERAAEVVVKFLTEGDPCVSYQDGLITPP